MNKYWWMLITIPVLAVFLFLLDKMFISRKIPKGAFIWTVFVIFGIFIFYLWFTKPKFHTIIYLIESIVFFCGGLVRLIYELVKHGAK